MKLCGRTKKFRKMLRIKTIYRETFRLWWHDVGDVNKGHSSEGTQRDEKETE